MTQQRALELYNQAKGTHITEKWLKQFPEANIHKTINDIIAVDKLCHNLGGGLCSRQMIAFIIHFSERK